MTINCIIIEDEPLASERVQKFVARLPFLNLLASFNNAIDALAFIRSHSVDLLFLDINMDQLSGIQLLESTSFKGAVIITTAYDQYALKGYELSVTDYLLKPYTFERFVQAVDKVHKQHQSKPAAPVKEFIFVKTENRLEKVNLNEILYIEGMRDYRRIHTTTKRIMTLQTFSELEQIIPATQLCRVHKSFMVAVDKIESLERSRIKIGEASIPMSDTYRKAFFELIQA